VGLNFTTTGLYWPTTSTLGFSTGGSEAMRIDSAQRLIVGGSQQAQIPDGTGTTLVNCKISSVSTSGVAAIGALVNNGTNNRSVGLFIDQTNAVAGISSQYFSGAFPFVYRDGTAERLRITTNGLVQIAAAGTAAAPAITIGGDTDTGMYLSAANQISIATNGNERFRVNSTGLISISSAGTAAAPAMCVGGDTNTGTFAISSDTFGFSTGGTERLRLDSTGNVIVNTAAVATTATDGFLYVAGCAGAPTGTPTAYTGRVPIVVDTTNNKLYFYSGGAWRDAGP
jgi:hypothetical protein